MWSGQQPFTERANALTVELDAHGALGCVRQVRGNDAAVFVGGHAGAEWLLSEAMVARVAQLAVWITEALAAGRTVLFQGCGTSGRVAYLAARGANAALASLGGASRARGLFRYAHAGGDEALVLSRELPEDSPVLGAAAVSAARPAVWVGISCGLSAPYVVGALEAAALQHGARCAIIGFNPVELARDLPVEGWSQTCRSCLLAVREQAADRVLFLTPVLGGEPVTGSSRMKGGTATKAMLDAACVCALQLLDSGAAIGVGATSERARAVVRASLACSCDCVSTAYDDAVQLAAMAERVHARLARSPAGRVVYLGDSVGGALAMIDASEMVDTYGCDGDEWRVFVDGGWQALGNAEGDISAVHPSLQVDAAQHAASWIRDSDAVVLVVSGAEVPGTLRAVLARARVTCEQLCIVRAVAGAESHAAAERDVEALARELGGDRASVLCAYAALSSQPPCALDAFRDAWPAAAEASLKSMTNAISTTVQVLRGAVYSNRMINVTVSNNKLFFRAADLVALYAGCGRDAAVDALLRSIYDAAPDALATLRSQPISTHVTLAAERKAVVPTAILLAAGAAAAVAEARALLKAHARLRDALAAAHTLH